VVKRKRGEQSEAPVAERKRSENARSRPEVKLIEGQGDRAEEDLGAEGEDEEGADTDARKVPTKLAKAYADEEGLLFFETSAKTGLNVAEVFTAIANAIPETSLKGPRGVGGQTNFGGRQDDAARVNLTSGRDAAGPKEGCAC